MFSYYLIDSPRVRRSMGDAPQTGIVVITLESTVKCTSHRVASLVERHTTLALKTSFILPMPRSLSASPRALQGLSPFPLPRAALCRSFIWSLSTPSDCSIVSLHMYLRNFGQILVIAKRDQLTSPPYSMAAQHQPRKAWWPSGKDPECTIENCQT